MRTKYKREETKIGLSLNTLFILLNIDINSILRSHSDETSRVYDIFMNFFVIPHEIREINKHGSQNKLQGSLQKLQKR